MPKKIRLKMSKGAFKIYYAKEVARIKKRLRQLAGKIAARRLK